MAYVLGRSVGRADGRVMDDLHFGMVRPRDNREACLGPSADKLLQVPVL